jgi:bifunctional non-homologous end joining protein LigD
VHSTCAPDSRSRTWIKLKCKQQQAFVVGGIARSKAGVDSLLLGVFERDGSLRYVGGVPPYFSRGSSFCYPRETSSAGQLAFPVAQSLRSSPGCRFSKG